MISQLSELKSIAKLKSSIFVGNFACKTNVLVVIFVLPKYVVALFISFTSIFNDSFFIIVVTLQFLIISHNNASNIKIDSYTIQFVFNNLKLFELYGTE